MGFFRFYWRLQLHDKSVFLLQVLPQVQFLLVQNHLVNHLVNSYYEFCVRFSLKFFAIVTNLYSNGSDESVLFLYCC